MSDIKDMLSERLAAEEKAEPPKVMRKIAKPERTRIILDHLTARLTALVAKSEAAPRDVSGRDSWDTIDSLIAHIESLGIAATKRSVKAALKPMVADGSIQEATFSFCWRLPASDIYEAIEAARIDSEKALDAYERSTVRAWNSIASTVPLKKCKWSDRMERDLPYNLSARKVEISLYDLRRVMALAFPGKLPADWPIDPPK